MTRGLIIQLHSKTYVVLVIALPSSYSFESEKFSQQGILLLHIECKEVGEFLQENLTRHDDYRTVHYSIVNHSKSPYHFHKLSVSLCILLL